MVELARSGSWVPDGWWPWLLAAAAVLVVAGVLIGRRERAKRWAAVESGRMSREEYDELESRDRSSQRSRIRVQAGRSIGATAVVLVLGIFMLVTGELAVGLICLGVGAAFALFWTFMIPVLRRQQKF
ncbi:hypothetical protein [Streptomyces sp. NPDC049881]|uniref:hypothetical protein n=1 Tax=unclassified Streptomyces TaxID=2593676 RepID=UPI00342A3B6F